MRTKDDKKKKIERRENKNKFLKNYLNKKIKRKKMIEFSFLYLIKEKIKKKENIIIINNILILIISEN